MAKKENTLHGLFVMKLNALLDIEQQLVKALPKMAEAASNQELTQAFEMHLEETEKHVERLEECLKGLGEKAKPLKCEAIRGLVEDAQWIIKNVESGPALDAALIAAAQYVEHYEMAGYGTAVEWAKMMAHSDQEALLQETLEEEKSADQKLSTLAMDQINGSVEMGMDEEG